MSSKRLQARLPKAKALGLAKVKYHQLKFHKHSFRDFTAKCDIHFTNNENDEVFGVIYKIEKIDKPKLDKIEGLGLGYEIKELDVIYEKRVYKTFTYYATDIKTSIKPFHWYKNHVLQGALEFSLPNDYIEKYIKNIESIDDEDKQREEKEYLIHK